MYCTCVFQLIDYNQYKVVMALTCMYPKQSQQPTYIHTYIHTSLAVINIIILYINYIICEDN